MALLYGMHDREGRHIVPAGGWVVDLAALSENPAPTNYTQLRGDINWLVRVNWGYGTTGTIPLPENDRLFMDRLAHYVHNSPGAHAWIIGNEPNHEQERPDNVYITPGRYADFFTRARTLIKTVNSNACVLPAACAPYHANPVPWIDYLTEMLQEIAANGGCDGLTLHTYTRSSNPADIESGAQMGPPLQNTYSGFLSYLDALDCVPSSMLDLPVYITEFNELLPEGWHNANTGVIQAAYADIHDTNQSGDGLPIQCLILYRWPKHDKWHIEGKQGVIDDFVAAVGRGYTSPVMGANVMPETVHLPFTPNETPAPTPDVPPYPVDWDPRLTERGVKIEHVNDGAPGTLSWRVTKGRWLDEQESQGRHHFYADVRLEDGARIVGAQLCARWPGDGYATFPTEDKPVNEPSANFPMSKSLNEFSFQVNEPKHPSEVVTGVGMGTNGNSGIHTSTYVEWTLYRMPATQQPAPEPSKPVEVQPVTGDNWRRSWPIVLKFEGGLSLDPNDTGNYYQGKLVGTKFGISAAVWGGQYDIPNLTKEQALAIYKQAYWDAVNGDALPWPLCLAVFDHAINAGVGSAKQLLAKSGPNFLTFMSERIAWYTRLAQFNLYGPAWIRRCAEVLREGAK